ncbi:MAG: NAD-dependent malic enzyme [Pseudomonadota bacterium]
MALERYRKWRDERGNEFRPVALSGHDLMNDPILNKGTAFTHEERDAFHLTGLIPPAVKTFEEQLMRLYRGYQDISTDIQKYIFLRSLQDRNETLFYALLQNHIEEMMPIIYTPTVGKACEEFSHHYRTARGLFITPRTVDAMDDVVHHFPSRNIKMIVVTDSQGILGIGDQGVGGMGIPIGKLSLYTLGSGIHPGCALPIVLDVGTDNEDLLHDPMYLGVPRKRMRGKEYELLIEKFVSKVKRLFPSAVLQWEDFSKENAFNNLNTYRKQIPSFNDDIQGTGAVVLAGLINAVKIKKERLEDQVYVVYGAGAGGVGVADQIYAGLIREGCDPVSAREKIFVLDSRGLIFNDRKNLEDYKKRYAKPLSIAANWGLEPSGQASLADIINHVPVTALIGACGVEGSFTNAHVSQMLKYTDRPIVFALSNPTSKCEAIPEDIFNWSNGRAIVATGSPFDDVCYEGNTCRIAQGNNAFIFPGVGFAAVLSKTREITVEMFTTASHALAECVSQADLEKGTVFPPIKDLRKVSAHVTVEVLTEIIKTDPKHRLHEKDLKTYVKACMWEPIYVPYRKV